MTLRLGEGGPQLGLMPRRLEPGEPVPDFTMTTESGATCSLSDLRGNVVVLTFIYTRCPLPTFCPMMDRHFVTIQEQLKADPFYGTIYCFRAKRADRVKLVFWDGTGLCLFCKRLEEGKFRWPRVQDGVMRLSAAQLSALLEGLDWSRVHAPRVTRLQAAQ